MTAGDRLPAVVIAGGTPTADHSLYSATGGRPKALLDIAGRPMIAHLLHSLHEAKQVDTVIVVGINQAQDQQAVREAAGAAAPTAFLPDAGGLVANGWAGLRWVRAHLPHASHILGGAADIPLVTGPMIDETIERCRPLTHTVYYPLVDATEMARVYPGAARTTARLANGERVTGGDLFVVGVDLLDTDPAVIQRLVTARKRPWRLARAAGLHTLVKLLLGRLSRPDLARLGGRLIGGTAAVTAAPHPAVGMDVDRSEHLAVVRKEVREKRREKRESKSTSKRE